MEAERPLPPAPAQPAPSHAAPAGGPGTQGKDRRRRALTLLGGLLVLLGAGLYYATRWSTLDQFFGSLDHCRLVFCDFQGVYHPQAREYHLTRTPVFGYYYSAFFAVLLAPLGLLGTESALAVWGVVELLATALLFALPVARVLRLSGRGAVLYLALFVTCLPVLHNFKWGQVSVFVTLTIVATLWAYRRGQPVLAGLLLSLGVSIKYYPVIFLPWYVFARDRRFLGAVLAGTLVFFVAVPALLMGLEHWWRFQEYAFSSVWQAVWMVDDQNSQYLPHVVQRFAARQGLDVGAGGLQALSWASEGVALLNVGLIWALWRRRVPSGHELAAVLLFLSVPLLIKTSWPHYFVHLPLCQVLLLREARDAAAPGRPALLVAAAVALSIALSSVFFFNAFDHWAEYSKRGFLLVADVLLLGAAWAVVARRLRTPRAAVTAPVAS